MRLPMLSTILRRDRLRQGTLAVLLVIFCLVPGSFAADRRIATRTMLSSGTYTAATGYSSGYDVSAYSEGEILVNVTAESGTSTLAITAQDSDDNSTYYDHTNVFKGPGLDDYSAEITATGQYRMPIANFGKYVRLKYVVGGTSFTFAAVGTFKN